MVPEAVLLIGLPVGLAVLGMLFAVSGYRRVGGALLMSAGVVWMWVCSMTRATWHWLPGIFAFLGGFLLYLEGLTNSIVNRLK